VKFRHHAPISSISITNTNNNIAEKLHLLFYETPMKTKSLQEIRSTLHKLWTQLPAVKARCTSDVVKQHVDLISYYQHQYDLLIEARAATARGAAN